MQTESESCWGRFTDGADDGQRHHVLRVLCCVAERHRAAERRAQQVYGARLEPSQAQELWTIKRGGGIHKGSRRGFTVRCKVCRDFASNFTLVSRDMQSETYPFFHLSCNFVGVFYCFIFAPNLVLLLGKDVDAVSPQCQERSLLLFHEGHLTSLSLSAKDE